MWQVRRGVRSSQGRVMTLTPPSTSPSHRSLTLSSGGTLQRKRSQSLADIQVPLGFRAKEPHHNLTAQHKKFSKTKSEESGYDSDTTRYLIVIYS